ncbi:transglycosylase domain-containing protein [Amycolatopsis pigmentata]|uniref:Transglycosylase domain-containing protein n=1 Tax=Amycolatopsis pigmentata TaxID=450801 RepID=A0ABW5FVL9_9PSEU
MTLSRKQRKSSKVWRRTRRTLYVLTGLALGVPAIAFMIGYLLWDVESPRHVLAELDRTVVLNYSDGTPMMKILPEDGDRQYVQFADVPAKLVSAIIAVEDPTFWTNDGFEPRGIVRAMVTGVGGGSGITQQYIKNSTGDDDASYFRKFKELVLATKVTRERSKQDIFESYVNLVSFGRNTHGPAAGMNAYFGKPLASMTWSQAAFLAGMLQAPYGHDPAAVGDGEAAKRWEYAANKLVERGYISPADRAAMAYPGKEIVPPGQTAGGKLSFTEYHIQQEVLAELEAQGYSLARLRREIATVRTTIDRNAQARAVQVLHDRLGGQPDYLRAAVVSIDPKTGGVLAYAGGDWSARDYASTPHRTGTAFRPFPRATAVARGEPVTPPNIRQTAYDAGIPEFVDGQRTLTQDDDVHIATTIGDGVYRLRPLDLAGAYATFANHGTRVPPHFVGGVGKGKPAFGDKSTAVAAMAVATGGYGPLPGEFRLGDTGDDYSDAWAINLGPQTVTAVWVGSDDERALRTADGRAVTGESLPTIMWHEITAPTDGVPRGRTWFDPRKQFGLAAGDGLPGAITSRKPDDGFRP